MRARPRPMPAPSNAIARPARLRLRIPARRRQPGSILFGLVVALLVLATSALVLQHARNAGDGADRTLQTRERMDRAAQALQRFALLHKRLPCPADGALDTGVALPPLAPPSPYRCGAPQGTLPWKSLGLDAGDAFDAWGRKLTYRVSDGANGVVRGGALERASTAGLAVKDRGSIQPDQAWVLISHGASGRGAWLPGGARRSPPPAGGDEATNTQPAPPAFVQRDEQVADLSADTATAHFDDLLQSRALGDVDAGFGLLRLDDRRLARPGPLQFSGRDSGTASLAFASGARHGDVALQAGGGHLARNGDISGRAIGVCAGACNSDATSMLAPGQSLSIRLLQPGAAGWPQKLALAVWSPGPAVQAGVTLRYQGAAVAGGSLALPSRPAGPAALVVWPDVAAAPAAAFDEIVLTATGGARLFASHLRLCAASEVCD